VSTTKFDRATILKEMVAILQEMTADWDLELEGGFQEETRIIEDIGFESVDVVQLVVAIEEHFQRRDLPFQEVLMRENRYVDELRVAEFVDFLAARL